MIDGTLLEGLILACESSQHKEAIDFLTLAIKDIDQRKKDTDKEFAARFWRAVRYAATPEMKRAWKQHLKERRMESPTIDLFFGQRALNSTDMRKLWDEKHLAYFKQEWAKCERCKLGYHEFYGKQDARNMTLTVTHSGSPPIKIVYDLNTGEEISRDGQWDCQSH